MTSLQLLGASLLLRAGKSCGTDDVSATDLLLHKDASIHGVFGVFKKSVETGSFQSD